MTPASSIKSSQTPDPEYDLQQPLECVGYDFGLSRRAFVKGLGAGLCIAVSLPVLAQERESGQRSRNTFLGTGAQNLAARIHLGTDGSITVMAGKVEAGQGARAELLQAAAEELRVPVSRVRMMLADTDIVPDDGMTAGSGTTPRTVPAVRRGAATARNLLIAFACGQWTLEHAAVEVQDGRVVHRGSNRSLDYADLARSGGTAKLFQQAIPADIELTPIKEWKVLGTSVSRPTARDLVTGAHKYPSDIALPGMLYGKILRRPAYDAKLLSIDLGPARAMPGVIVIRDDQDDQFVGVAAPTTFRAERALATISDTAKWGTTPQSSCPRPSGSKPSSKDLFDYLRHNAEGGPPSNPFTNDPSVAKTLRRTYNVPYIQHAPLEPRAAVAEWKEGRLIVWTGSQNPFGVRGELARAFHLPEDQVRVVIPDFGAAFGGKHTGECAVEAARLARGAGKPVSLRWTREEEFTWAYFRPAGVIEAEASLDAEGKIATWYFININSGPNAVDTPYSIGKTDCRFIPSTPPLRHGSYRGLAATANNFAREVFIDELAAATGSDPLAFRHAHLANPRLRAVLDAATSHFRWQERANRRDFNISIGLACGTEKGSYVAACAEIEIDRQQKKLKVRNICEAFECGAIVNPGNLLSQIQGATIMGLGAALSEEIQFENGRILNASFGEYHVPRLEDVPELDIHLINRPDLPSAGAGETPIIAIAPAIANAVFRATGASVQALPIRI